MFFSYGVLQHNFLRPLIAGRGTQSESVLLGNDEEFVVYDLRGIESGEHANVYAGKCVTNKKLSVLWSKTYYLKEGSSVTVSITGFSSSYNYEDTLTIQIALQLNYLGTYVDYVTVTVYVYLDNALVGYCEKTLRENDAYYSETDSASSIGSRVGAPVGGKKTCTLTTKIYFYEESLSSSVEEVVGTIVVYGPPSTTEENAIGPSLVEFIVVFVVSIVAVLFISMCTGNVKKRE